MTGSVNLIMASGRFPVIAGLGGRPEHRERQWVKESGAGLCWSRMMSVVRAVFCRIDLALIGYPPTAVVENAEKAGFVAFVASGLIAVLIDAQQDRVGIAIDTDFAHGLEIARLFALSPQTVARA